MATKLTINIRKAKKEIIDSLIKNQELQHATVDGTLRIGIDFVPSTSFFLRSAL